MAHHRFADVLAQMRRDVAAVLDRDPATTTRWEAILWCPGLHAIWAFRLCHWLWGRGWRSAARGMSTSARAVTGVEIHPAAQLGPGLLIDHGMGVVIGETTRVART
jgi:serine O-acetyltransferase